MGVSGVWVPLVGIWSVGDVHSPYMAIPLGPVLDAHAQGAHFRFVPARLRSEQCFVLCCRVITICVMLYNFNSPMPHY